MESDIAKDVREAVDVFKGPDAATSEDFVRKPSIGKTKLKKIGNSLGVTLPKKFLDIKGFVEGDSFTIIEAEDGLKLVPYDAEFEQKMEIAKRIMREHRDVLRELAK